MKQVRIGILTILFLLFVTLTGYSQKKEMTWTTKSKAAKELALSGTRHMMNPEFAQAYSDFSAALKLDPQFTVALVYMSNLARGDARKAYGQRALQSASNKTQGEKLFASLAGESLNQENRREIWTKLHAMFPDDATLGHFYVQTRATPEERFTAAQEYIKQFPDQPGMHNVIAYYYLNDKKDNAMARQHFEKYISLYQDGANPYDSMGEFYEITGDTANSRKYYLMALDKYPFNNSSLNALQKMDDAAKKTETK